MKKWLFIAGILIGFVVVLTIILLVLKPGTSSEPVVHEEPGFELDPAPGGVFVPATSGEPIKTNSFTEGAPVLEQPSGTYYYVTYNQNYEPLDPAYGIVYGSDGSFAIGIFQEPLGASRRKAEDKLRSLLGVSDTELCRLTTTVMVPPSVNEAYAARNLGLSFCPGATPLPN